MGETDNGYPGPEEKVDPEADTAEILPATPEVDEGDYGWPMREEARQDPWEEEDPPE